MDNRAALIASTTPDSRTSATYLAQQFIFKKAYKVGTEPEIEELRSASDIVLTRTDGFTFDIVCIVDCEAHPDKRFDLPMNTVADIGERCRNYVRRRMPVRIRIIEAGRPITFESRRRLALYRQWFRVIVSAWIFDPPARAVWGNAVGQFLEDRRFLRSLVNTPRWSEAELRPKPPAMVRQGGFPLVTAALLGVLATVFAAEQIYAVGSPSGWLRPNPETLLALGGLHYGRVVGFGEWYRVITAPLLHADLSHLLFNGVALVLAGWALERFIGPAWFAACAILGAVSGSLMSLAVNPPNVVGVGASGAISALLAAGYICSFRLPYGNERTRIQMRLLQVLVPALIPLASAGKGQIVDYGAHFGGALSGAVLGYAMLRIWPDTTPLPRFRRLAAAISAAGIAVYGAAAWPLHNDYLIVGSLIPQNEMPKSDEDAKARSAHLVAHYPRDPRSHLFRATALLESKDVAGAEQELQAGLANEVILRRELTPIVEAHIRTMLAEIMVKKGDSAGAKSVAQPVCAMSLHWPDRQSLEWLHLCG